MLETETLEKPETEDAVEEDDQLFCAACGEPITRERHAISRREDHEHTVFNPLGQLFVLRCFEEAPGAQVITPPSPVFTWFPGYSWQIASCRGCSRHIGWAFVRIGERFYGLIKGMLVRG